MPTLETYNGYPLWHYVPSIAGSIIFTILFTAVTTIHLWQMFRTRAWYFVPFCIGGSCKSQSESGDIDLSIFFRSTRLNYISSGGRRIPWSRYSLQQNRRARAVHRAKHLHLARPGPVISDSLYDA
nr:hypothetical protein CFP56_30200 [Quercus suber]